MESPRQQPVQSICNSRDDEAGQRQDKSLVEEERNEERNQGHPEDGQDVWQGYDSRGHS
jgi:hypothetical protein